MGRSKAGSRAYLVRKYSCGECSAEIDGLEEFWSIGGARGGQAASGRSKCVTEGAKSRGGEGKREGSYLLRGRRSVTRSTRRPVGILITIQVSEGHLRDRAVRREDRGAGKRHARRGSHTNFRVFGMSIDVDELVLDQGCTQSDHAEEKDPFTGCPFHLVDFPSLPSPIVWLVCVRVATHTHTC